MRDKKISVPTKEQKELKPVDHRKEGGEWRSGGPKEKKTKKDGYKITRRRKMGAGGGSHETSSIHLRKKKKT